MGHVINLQVSSPEGLYAHCVRGYLLFVRLVYEVPKYGKRYEEKEACYYDSYGYEIPKHYSSPSGRDASSSANTFMSASLLGT